MEDMEQTAITRVDYRHASPKIRYGWVLMLIGSILFLVMSALDLAGFGLAMSMEEIRSDLSYLGDLIWMVLTAVLLLFAGIGGICFLTDRSRLKIIGTLAAVVVLVVFVVDTALIIRTLVHDLVGRSTNITTGQPYTAGEAWLRFVVNLLDLQLSGGIYLGGWSILKDYVGDDYDQKKPKK